MAKKLKKAKKGMSPKAKFTLVNSFKGLISNQAVIDGSRGSAWWVAAIFLAFSVILPLVPTFAQLSKLNGASFVGNYVYGLDDQLSKFAYEFKKDSKEFRVEGGELHYYDNWDNTAKSGTDRGFFDPASDVNYFNDRKYGENGNGKIIMNSETNQIDAIFFFWVDENLAHNIDTVVNQSYTVGTSHAPVPTDTKTYIPNLIFFTPSTMAVALYKENTPTRVAVSNGGLDWKNSDVEHGLIERLLGEHYDKVNVETENTFVNKHREDVMNAFRGVCTETYLNQKSKTKWTNTGIYFGIYAGVIVFLGLMVFILTRGKNNPYKFLNIWECQKISWWGAASPAIIGTILSLIFSGNAIGQMAFILVVSLRIMWLSMKQLRPVIQ